jgi:hypothetical protein
MVAAAGCRERQQAAPPQPRKAATTTAVETVAPGTTSKDVAFLRPNYLDVMLVGRPQKAADAVTPNENFKRGETIRTVVKLKLAPGGLGATLEAWNSKEQQTFRERKLVPEGAKSVTFDWAQTKQWAAGDYTLHLFLGADDYAQHKVSVK